MVKYFFSDNTIYDYGKYMAICNGGRKTFIAVSNHTTPKSVNVFYSRKIKLLSEFESY